MSKPCVFRFVVNRRSRGPQSPSHPAHFLLFALLLHVLKETTTEFYSYKKNLFKLNCLTCDSLSNVGYMRSHTGAENNSVRLCSRCNWRLFTLQVWLFCFVCFFRAGKMVKLGNNFSEKNNGKVVSEDGFDTIPLITPLDASQLQFPPPDKVRLFFCLIFSIDKKRVTVMAFYFCISITPVKLVQMNEN